jgi:CHAT domain-containing protein
LTRKASTPVATGKSQATLFGFPNYGSKGSIHPLPGTKVEIDNIKKVLAAKGYPTKTFMQDNASEEQIKNITNPRILHIATHGFFLNDVGETTEKVLALNLIKPRRIHYCVQV